MELCRVFKDGVTDSAGSSAIIAAAEIDAAAASIARRSPRVARENALQEKERG